MADVFTLDGTALDLAATDALPVRFKERFGTIATLHLQRRGVQPPPESSDPWMGRSLTWEHDGTLYFSGTIRSRSPRRDALCGWVIDYQAFGLRDLLDRFPVTDKTTGLDVSPFNCHPEDLVNYNAARAGRTVGQVLADVLTSTTNAQALIARGVGNLTFSGGAYHLPADTVADLAALTIVPPRPCYFVGEKMGDGIDGFLSAQAPNVRHWVRPDGTMRFLDLTTFGAGTTLTMGVDPIEPTEISRDVADCWQRLQIRGAPLAVLAPFKLSRSTLVEDFGYTGASTNALAKAAWTSNDFKGTTTTQDSGSCSMSSTTTVVVTTTQTYISDQWDQTSTGSKGTINLEWSSGTGITTFWTSRIVANTATSGGTSTITIDAPAPHTSFDKFTITGQASGKALVWRKYKIADTSLWDKVVAQSTYPQAVVNGGGGATLTSTAIGLVFWPQSGSSPPYNCFPLPFVWDGSTGHVLFQAPTYIVANNQAPADVWVYLPVNTGPNLVTSPPDVSGVARYSGDSHSTEGLADTLVCTMADWRDPGQLSQVQAFADDWLKSVKDGVREASITYHGLYEPALTFGMALNIAGLEDDGTASTTGWEAAAIPVIEVDIEWPNQSADDYITTIGVSSRRAHYSAEMFLRPERTWQNIGLADGMDTFGGGPGYQAALSDYQRQAEGVQQPYQDALGQHQDALSHAGDGPRGTDLGAPTIAPGYGGEGSLDIPRSLDDLGVDRTGGFDLGGGGWVSPRQSPDEGGQDDGRE